MSFRSERYRRHIETRRRSAGRDRLVWVVALLLVAGLATWQGLTGARAGGGPPPGPYELRAVDLDDRPVAGVTLRFFRPDGSTADAFEAVTGEDGKVLLPEERWSGDWVCQGRDHDGVLSQGGLTRWEPRNGEIRFGPPAALAGRLSDDLGAVLAGVALEVRHRMREGPALARVETDEGGRFTLPDLSASFEALRFRGRVDGYPDLDVETEVSAEEPIELVVEASMPLQVRVLDPAGRPSPGHRVELMGVADSERRCDQDGLVEFRGLSRRWTYKVLIDARGMTYRQPEDLSPSSAVHEIRLEEPLSLLGRVLDAKGKPVYGLELRHAYGNQGIVSTRTGSGGRFHIGGLPAGRVELVYDLPDGRVGRLAAVSGSGEVLLRLDG
ncbi:MAG: carboxypeptidase-like regulatory domain-containing protein [Planctomycetota bacterium]